MKKLLFAALLAACVVLPLAAQSGGSGAASFSTEYVLANFAETRIEDGRLRGAGIVKSTRGVSIEERQVFGGLDDNHTISTASELLAMASVLGIQDVKKEDALKLYAEIAMEGAANSFLGVTGTTHGQVLERLKAKYNFTQAEINGAIRQTVAAAVDAEFGKISFVLETNMAKSYIAILTRDSKTGQYTLSYERPSVQNDDKEIFTPTLQALLDAMRRNTADFSQTSIDHVRAQAGLIPAVSQSGKTGNVEPRVLVTHGLTAFFTARTRQEMTEALKIIEGICVIRLYPLKHSGQQEKDKAIATEDAIYATLSKFSSELSNTVNKEVNRLLLAFQANKPALENVLNRAERSVEATRR